MKIIKAFSKQLFGAKYESVINSLLVATILFWIICTIEIKVTIAPFILYLTSTFFTAGVMGRLMVGRWNETIMKGVLMLPFENREFIFSYVLSLCAYVLITKTLIIWALFFAAGTWDVLNVVVAVLCGCMACLTSIVIHLICRRNHIVFAIFWGTGIIVVLMFVHKVSVVSAVALVNIIISLLYLSYTDPYDFYYIEAGKKRSYAMDKKANIFFYLLRYIVSNKNYLINTIGMSVVACFLPLLFSEFRELKIFPVGLAILCLNTPICTLLSSDKYLEAAIRVLPSQLEKFCLRYCLFIFTFNIFISGIYLCSWQLINRGIGVNEIMAVLLFTLQSAVLSVILEYKRPIRNWKTENDLWHHPRKYIVPLILLFMAVIISTCVQIIYVWFIGLIMECFILVCMIKRS